MKNKLTESIKSFFSFKKKSETDSFSNIALVENYDANATSIENIEDYYKLITKISSIPKSLGEITKAITSKDYIIQDVASKKEIENPPDLLTEIIKKPYRNYDYDEFISLLNTDLHIGGNIFTYRVKDNYSGRLSITRINPQYIEKLHGEWVENNPDYGMIKLKEEFLTHVKYTPDPYNPMWGKGIIAENITLFKNTVKKLEYEDSFFEKGCTPSSVFSIENSGSVNQAKIEKDIENKYQGSKNAGKAIVLTGKVDFKPIQLDPAGMKLDENLTLRDIKIMSAFGLPRFLMELGLRDNGQKFNNHEKQEEHWIKNTIIPTANKIEKVFNELVVLFNPNWRFKFKVNAEIYSEETLQKLADAGEITYNEHRKLLNLSVSDNKLLDKNYLAAGKATIEAVAEGIVAPEPEPEPESSNNPSNSNPEPGDSPNDKKPPKKKIDNGKERIKSWRDNFYLSEPENNIWTVNEIKKDVNLKRIRQDFHTLNKKTQTKKTKEFTKKFDEYLTRQYIIFFENMKKNETELEKLTNPNEKADADIKKYIKKIYNAEKEAEIISEVGTVLYQSVGSATFSNTENILTASVPFSIIDPGVAAKVNLLRVDTVKVATSTLNQIEEVIVRGIKNNSTAQEVAKDMWRHFVDENKDLPDSFTVSNVSGKRLADRAVTIARQEVNRANRTFAVESMKKSGVVKSIQLVGVVDADEQCTPYFNQNFPYEMEGELSNIHINCRCTIVPGEISVEG